MIAPKARNRTRFESVATFVTEWGFKERHAKLGGIVVQLFGFSASFIIRNFGMTEWSF